MTTRNVSFDIDGRVSKAVGALNSLDRSVLRTANSLERLEKRSRASSRLGADLDKTAKSAGNADRSINQLTGRLSLLADVVAMIGPAGVPIAAVAVPALSGLANVLGVAALAGGTAIMSFQGVGAALKAVNEAGIEPTEENLEKARAAMAGLAPEARELVARLQELRPVLSGIRDEGAENLMPGVVELLDSLETRVPEVERIVGNMAATLGGLADDTGESLASDRWDEFFDFLATDAPQTMAALGSTVGDLTHGMAELWMAMDPGNDDFSMWLMDTAAGFDQWATNLRKTEGAAEFLAYVRETGPDVAGMFGALANSVLQVAEAAAPLGGPVLNALEGVFKVIGAIADSDLGTPIFAGVAALAAFNRVAAVTAGLKARMGSGGMLSSALGADKIGSYLPAIRAVTAATDDLRAAEQKRADLARKAAQSRSALIPETAKRGALDAYLAANRDVEAANRRVAETEEQKRAALRGSMGAIAKSAGVVGGLALISSGLADELKLSNTAMLGVMGTMAGPWGAAIGAAVGFTMDLAGGQERSAESIAALTATLNEQTGALTAASREWAKTELADAGAFDAAETLGLDLKTLTDAAMGSASAMALVSAATQEYIGFANLSSEALAAGTITKEQLAMGEAAKVLQGALPGLAGDISKTSDEAREQARQMRAAGDAGRDASSGIMSLSDASKNAARAATVLTEALRKVDEALSGRSSLRDYEQAIDDYADALKKAKKDGADFLNETRTGFNRNTQAGRDMEASLDNIASTAVAAASELQGMDKVRVLTRARGDLRRAALDAGLTRKATRELIMEVYDLDGLTAKAKAELDAKAAEREIRKIEQQLKKYGLTTETAQAALKDVATGKIKSVQGLINKYGITRAQAQALLNDAASGKINGIRANLRSLDGDRANTWTTNTITTVRHTINKVSRAIGGVGLGPFGADGLVVERQSGRAGLIQTYADGGMHEPRYAGTLGARQPGILPYAGRGGIVMNEEGSGPWEGIVSGHPAKRNRSRAVTTELAARLGGEVTWYADGGVRGGADRRAGQSRRDRIEQRVREGNEDRKRGNKDRRDGHKDAKNARAQRRRELQRQATQLNKMYESSVELNREIQENFRTDPFENNATLQGVVASLRADKNNAGDFRAVARRADKLGLDGRVFQSLLASGNTAVLEDLDRRSEVKMLEKAWRQRNRVTADLTFGAATSGRYSGDSLNQLERELRQLRGEIKRMGRNVRDGARQGTREGSDRERRRRNNQTSKGKRP